MSWQRWAMAELADSTTATRSSPPRRWISAGVAVVSRGRLRYVARCDFDTREWWTARIVLKSAAGDGETSVDVEVTPPGARRRRAPDGE